MTNLLIALRAAGEPTRLRILAAVDRTELTVSELCRVLDQTQPRVSRHLKLLCDAGMLVRHAEGTSAFYGPAPDGTGRALYDAILEFIDLDDPAMARDLHRLDAVRSERAEAAATYFEAIAGEWDRVRQLHVADEHVEAAMLDAVADLSISELIDIGTGTGRMLEIFAPKIRHGLGIDLSSKMLNLARTRLDRSQLRHCSVRRGSAYDIDLDAGSIDVAVLHHVLHFLDDPGPAIAQGARVLRPGGRLLIVDFGPHDMEELRSEFAHRRLGFSEAEIRRWCEDADLIDLAAHHMRPELPTGAGEELTVTLWVATQRADAPATYRLEAAS